MVRTQISLPEELHRRVTEAARGRGQSMAALIRELLERELEQPNIDAEMLEAVRSTPFRSGASDISINHDRYLGDNEDGRW